MSKDLKVAVVSDLHAYSKEDEIRHSYLRTFPSDDPLIDPIESLKILIEKDDISADYLVCCGDYTNKARPEPFYYAWEKLNEISEMLGSKIITTVGNHDLDTRAEYNHFDPRGMVLNSKPSFPFSDDTLNNKFWAKSYTILEEELVNFVSLNSCAYHGYGEANSEIHHGRISHYTIKDLKEDLQKIKKKDINILVCHHHPMKHNGIDYEDDQVMKKGDQLIELLSDFDFGEWLIIHGHLHVPYLSYGQKGVSVPTIFSSASFSAKEGACFQSRFRNQFYLLKFNFNDIYDLGLVGIGQSWNYSPDIGWEEAGLGTNEMMPKDFGFGFKTTLKSLSRKIESLVLQSEEEPKQISWKRLLVILPEVKYLLPHDQSELLKHLSETKVGVEFVSGIPIKVMER